MDEQLERACVACDEIYRSGLACPTCGEPNEPLGVPMVELIDDQGEWLRGDARDKAIRSYTDKRKKAYTVY